MEALVCALGIQHVNMRGSARQAVRKGCHPTTGWWEGHAPDAPIWFSLTAESAVVLQRSTCTLGLVGPRVALVDVTSRMWVAEVVIGRR